ncbi:response regulator [Piscinibacter koreensis]|uniref:Response regulator n=1 Tax=Piscinibacter koreensis TaxID=2742824 RepID=A0A7Y6NJD1_9BURK|nr:response regulator [Schlegelella koreensis]NUZ04260.1 response regulator [Schlegelella koreensis]
MEKLKTFVVEDSSVIRENLIATLEENVPLEIVGVAEDEQTAVHCVLAAEQPVDLVIVDIFLKAGSGLGVLKGIASLGRATRKMVFSNHATPDIRAKCIELGADKVFDKSNEIEEMLAYCNRLAASHAHA